MSQSPSPDQGSSAFDWIRRRWWFVVLVPVVALIASYALSQMAPYQSEVRATVLIPGDTEDPGNSERPELMVLDDLPSLVRSYVFADSVQQGVVGIEVSTDEVQDSLDGTRYSRVLTVIVEGDDPGTVFAIAQAVEQVLAAEINAYLVPDESEAATVNIIDPATEPERDTSDLWFNMFLVGTAALLVGALIAIAIGAYEDSRMLDVDSPASEPLSP